jgi:integrase/recombinase XerD
MNEIAEAFFRYLSIERSLSKNTAYAYSRDVNAFIEHCKQQSINPMTIDAHSIEEYLWHLRSSLRLKPSSVARKIESIRAFYRFLILDGKISKDPTRNFKSPKRTEKVPEFLSKKDIEKLLSYPAGSNFSILRTIAIMEFFYATGIRISELLSLRLESVNLEQGWVRVFGKGRKERIVPVHEKAIATLKKYLDERQLKFGGKSVEDTLFVNRNGRHLSRVQVWKDIIKLGKLCGLGAHLHPHIFRHTFASHLLHSGADLRSLQEMLGHASLNTTQIYTHIEKSNLKSAHEKFHPDKNRVGETT